MKYTTSFSALLPAFASAFVPSTHHSSIERPKCASSMIAMSSAPPTMEILDDVSIDAPSFAIAPDDLVALAKDVLVEKKIGIEDGGKCLADDFEFVAAVVGPIGKQAYLDALGSFRLEDGFDISNNFFGFNVDPTQPNRVWFFQRLNAVHSGTFVGKEATGKEIEYPPQVNHMDFNDKGEVTEYGFYTVDRRQGNTGGLGGAFGFMYAVGKPLPIPECQPYKPSKRFRLLQLIGNFASRFQKKEQ